jgi:hypothetical protein
VLDETGNGHGSSTDFFFNIDDGSLLGELAHGPAQISPEPLSNGDNSDAFTLAEGKRRLSNTLQSPPFVFKLCVFFTRTSAL